MKLSEKLLVLAAWFENEDNELLCEADSDEQALDAMADTFAQTAQSLKDSAARIAELEGDKEEDTLINLTAERLEEMAILAEEFDKSGDELLIKQASVLDEILLTLAAPKNYAFNFKRAEDYRIEELKKKYKDTKEEQDDMNKVSDSLKAIEKSPMYKEYRPLEAPLTTRYCPDHSGTPMSRIGEHIFQCAMDKKVYNYETGFTTLKGNKVPGGSVEYQTPKYHEGSHMVFDTRSDRLSRDR